MGLQSLNLKRKTKWNLVVVVKWRHHENGLLVNNRAVYELVTFKEIEMIMNKTNNSSPHLPLSDKKQQQWQSVFWRQIKPPIDVYE